MKNAPNHQPDPRKDTSTYINSPSGNSAANIDSPFFQEEIPRGSSTPSCKPKVSKSRGYCQTHNIHPKESKSHTQVTVWCAALAWWLQLTHFFKSLLKKKTCQVYISPETLYNWTPWDLYRPKPIFSFVTLWPPAYRSVGYSTRQGTRRLTLSSCSRRGPDRIPSAFCVQKVVMFS